MYQLRMASLMTSFIRHVIVITIFSGICADQACAYNVSVVTTRVFQNYGVQGIKVTSFIRSTSAASRVKCCDICANTDGCVVANYNKSGRQCRLSDVDTWYNLVTSSILQEGWNLFYDADVDECSSNPCQNGGTCIDQMNAYTCNCLTGYVGTTCETNTDECAGDPCMNDGTCVYQVNAYSCSCIPGYVGTNCETDTDECTGNPCMNGGTCVDQVNAYTCSCIARYVGMNCETLTSCAYSDMVLANNQCYYFSAYGPYTREFCDNWYIDNKYGYLVDITSEAELESIKLAYENAIGGTHSIWIGGNDISVEGTLVWYDGTPVVGGYTRWRSAGLNNNDANDCIAMDLSANWTWTIANCDNPNHCVAEENNDN